MKAPKSQLDYQHYFCCEPGADEETLSEKEALRLTLYQLVAKLIRAFTNLAGELEEAGYSASQAASIKQEVEHFAKVRDEIKLASGDLVDMKQFEPGMRQMLDLWVDADPSETLMDFEELGLLELIIQRGPEALDGLPRRCATIRSRWPRRLKTTCAGPSSMRTRSTPNTTRGCRCCSMS